MPPKLYRLESSQNDKSAKTPVIHRCGQCDKSFPNKRELTLHQYIHKEKPNTTCAECNRNFPNEVSYKRHMRIHADRDKRLRRCQICPAAFTTNQELEQHHRDEHLTDKPFRCDVCGACFSWQANLQKHQRMHKPTSHVCSVCNQGFSDSTSLRIHQRNAHNTKPNTGQDKPFTCKVCKKSFMYDFSYEAHLNSHKLPCTSATVKIIKPKTPFQLTGSGIQAKLNGKTIVLKPNMTQGKVVGLQNTLVTSPCMVSPNQAIPFVQRLSQPAVSNTVHAPTEPANCNLPPQRTQTLMAQYNDENTIAKCNTPNLLPTTSCTSDAGQSSYMQIESEDKDGKDSASGSDDNEGSSSDDDDLGDDKKEGEDSDSESDNADSASSNDESSSGSEAPPLSPCMPLVHNESCKEQIGDVVANNSNLNVTQTEIVDEKNSVPDKEHQPSNADKSKPRKRNIKPLKYNFVMTEEKPFECTICKARFRWQISYDIHCKDHEKNKCAISTDPPKSRKRSYVPTYPPGSVLAQSEQAKTKITLVNESTMSAHVATTSVPAHTSSPLAEAVGSSMRMINQSTQITTAELQLSDKVSIECQTMPCETSDETPSYTMLRAVPHPTPVSSFSKLSKLSASSRIVSRNASDDEDFFESPSSPYDFPSSEQHISTNTQDSHLDSLRVKLKKNEGEGDFHVVQKSLAENSFSVDLKETQTLVPVIKAHQKTPVKRRTGPIRKSPRSR